MPTNFGLGGVVAVDPGTCQCGKPPEKDRKFGASSPIQFAMLDESLRASQGRALHLLQHAQVSTVHELLRANQVALVVSAAFREW